jgi:hypothetical protein
MNLIIGNSSERLSLGLQLISTLLHEVVAYRGFTQKKTVPGLVGGCQNAFISPYPNMHALNRCGEPGFNWQSNGLGSIVLEDSSSFFIHGRLLGRDAIYRKYMAHNWKAQLSHGLYKKLSSSLEWANN